MVRKLLESERGFALMTTLGIMLVLTILAVGLMMVAQNDLTMTVKSKRLTQALHVAEAGIDKALWQLKKTQNLPASFEVETPLGIAYVTASQDATNTWLWRITSRGVTEDGVKRTIKVTVFNLSYWDMFFAGGTSQSLTAGGGGIVGTTSVHGPFFVRGNLELSGTSFIRKGPLFVRDGDIILASAAASIGTADEPIDVFVSGSAPTDSSQFHANLLSHHVPNIVLPDLVLSDMKNHLNDAKEQSAVPYTNTSYVNCQTDYYKLVDDDLSVSIPLGSGDVPLTISSSTVAFGNPTTDDFAWDPTTKTLTVKGTVFVDGPVQLGNATGPTLNIKYRGNGAIVTNGDINIYGKLLPSGNFPSDDFLGLVTPTNIYIHTQSSNPSDPETSPPDIAGALYGKIGVTIEKNILIKGGLVAGTLAFNHPNVHLVSQPQLSLYLPEAMPGGTQYILQSTGWHEAQ